MGYTFCLMRLVTLHFLFNVCDTNAECASFEFPLAGNSTTYRVQTNTQLAFPFTLDTSLCPGFKGSYKVVVSKKDHGKVTSTDICVFVVDNNGICRYFGIEGCLCENEKGYYSLTKIIRTKDYTQWRWTILGVNIARDRYLDFVPEDEPSHPDDSEYAAVSTIRNPSEDQKFTTNGIPNDSDVETGTTTFNSRVEDSTETQGPAHSTSESEASPSNPAEAAAAVFVGIVIAVVGLSVIIMSVYMAVTAVRRCKQRCSA